MNRSGSAWLVSRIALCDFRLTWKDRSVIIWSLLMPLVFIFVFGQIKGGGSPSDVKATLTIENHDDGPVSKALIASLGRENLVLVFEIPEGGAAVRSLVIPEDFSEKVLSRERTRLVLRKDEGSNAEAGQTAEVAVARALVKTVSALLEIEGGIIRDGNGPISMEGDSLSGNLRIAVENRPDIAAVLEAGLDSIIARTPAITVASSFAGKAKEIPRGYQSSVPGNLVMFVLMGMAFSGIVITQERRAGILARTAVSPARKRDIVAGKLAGRMMVGIVQILVLLVAGRFIFKISLGNDVAALVILMVAFAFCCGAFSLVFGSLFGNPDQVAGFAIVTTLVMSALGGCWWPLEVVPQPFRVIAFCLPTGWMMDGIHKLISFGYGLGSVAPHILVLVLFGAAFLAVASARLKLAR
jgi:ABC-type multidrug transport system permease subunit